MLYAREQPIIAARHTLYPKLKETKRSRAFVGSDCTTKVNSSKDNRDSLFKLRSFIILLSFANGAYARGIGVPGILRGEVIVDGLDHFLDDSSRYTLGHLTHLDILTNQHEHVRIDNNNNKKRYLLSVTERMETKR